MAIGYRGWMAAVILSVQIVGRAAAEDPASVGGAVVMNGRERPDLELVTDAQGGWSFRYERDLREDPAAWIEKDAPRTDMRWKGWDAHADKWRNGLYGRHLTFEVEFPYPGITVFRTGPFPR